jgi:hypothetical protein
MHIGCRAYYATLLACRAAEEDGTACPVHQLSFYRLYTFEKKFSLCPP